MVTLNVSEFAHAAKSSAAYSGWEEERMNILWESQGINTWWCATHLQSHDHDMPPYVATCNVEHITQHQSRYLRLQSDGDVDLQGGQAYKYIDHLGRWRD